MSTDYLHRLYVVSPAAVSSQIRSLFAQFERGAADDTLPHRLSASGEEPGTHFAACTVITEIQRQALLSLMQSGDIPSQVLYLITPNVPESTFVSSNLDFAAEAASSFDDFLQAAGLQSISD